MASNPKKYECLDCGFISSRSKSLTIGPLGFARCFKCRGRVKERAEWLDWYHKQWADWRKGLPKAPGPTESAKQSEADNGLEGEKQNGDSQ